MIGLSVMSGAVLLALATAAPFSEVPFDLEADVEAIVPVQVVAGPGAEAAFGHAQVEDRHVLTHALRLFLGLVDQLQQPLQYRTRPRLGRLK